jgi:HSP20 family protein
MLDLVRRPSGSLGLSTFEEMDKLFDNFWRSAGLPSSTFTLPSVDIYSEDEDRMIVEMQAPGFSTKDIEINARNGILEIRGEKLERNEEKENKRNYMVRESNASFARRVVLPEGADSENISAELENGVLKIAVPVNRPEAKRIEIKSPAKKIKSKN